MRISRTNPIRKKIFRCDVPDRLGAQSLQRLCMDEVVTAFGYYSLHRVDVSVARDRLDLIGQRPTKCTQWRERLLAFFQRTKIDGGEKQDSQAIWQFEEPGQHRQFIGGGFDELAIKS